MKSFFTSYFALIIMILFIIYNFSCLDISGLLYQIFMILVIVINAVILIKFGKIMNYKCFIIIVYFITGLFSKDILQLVFSFSSMLILIVIDFMKSNFIKIVSIIIVVLYVVLYTVFLLPLIFFNLIVFNKIMPDKSKSNYAYEDTHYFCKNNYELYVYSIGAMDSFHYSIDKHYIYLNINGTIYISCTLSEEVSQEDYNSYLNTHSCRLVGEIDGFK